MFTVMIVDDMDFARLEIRRLKLWGERYGFYIAKEAKDGKEALSMLRDNPVDLVITDIKMPRIDGIELLEKIMEECLCQCVVLLSDYSDFNYVRKGLVLGAFDYIKKPASEDEIENLLDRARNFILEKRKEIERVKKLEEKAEIYSPRVDANQIINLILDGDLSAIDAGEHMLKVIWIDLNNDHIKAEIAIKNVLLEIIKEVFEQYSWLDKFLCAKELGNMDFSEFNTLEKFTIIFNNSIKTITAYIKLLYCSNCDSEVVKQICACVLQNLDGEISLGIVADKLFMNKTYISELFKQKTGIGFVEYLKTAKMERAKKLVNEGKLKIYEIGEMLGYKDIEYFSRLFKKYTGWAPVEYRQNNVKKAK